MEYHLCTAYTRLSKSRKLMVDSATHRVLSPHTYNDNITPINSSILLRIGDLKILLRICIIDFMVMINY